MGDLPTLSGFRVDVQALRGIAVLLVVLYHAQLGVPGGFVGVDIFFVISGFVIGRRLVARLAGPQPVIKDFYLRRARRILPALALMLVVVVLLTPWLAPVAGVYETRSTGTAAALFSANLQLYRATAIGYFDAPAQLNALLHTWSLSVEEQFYFVVPVLLVAAWAAFVVRRRSAAGFRCVVGAIAFGSFALCLWLSYADQPPAGLDGLRFAFFSPLTRAWEFAVGLMIVLVPARMLARGMVARSLVVVGGALIAVAAFDFSDTTRFPGIAVVVPVVGAALVVYGGTTARNEPPSATTASVLRPLTWSGDVSYGWYLWHWPLIVFAAAFWPRGGGWPLALAAAVSLVPAWLSYRFVERGLRATSRTRPMGTLALAIVCVVTPVAVVVVSAPLMDHFATRAVDRRIDLADADPSPVERTCNSLLPRGRRPAACTFGDATAATRIVLMGDSRAASLSETFIGAARARGDRLELVTRPGCPLIASEFEWGDEAAPDTSAADCSRFVADSLAALRADPPDVVVLTDAMGNWIFNDLAYPVDPVSGTSPTSRAQRGAAYEALLTASVRDLQAAGTSVVLVDPGPTPFGQGDRFEIRACSRLAIVVDIGRCLPQPFTVDEGGTGSSSEIEDSANAVRRRVAAQTGAEVWSFGDQVCPDGLCAPVRDDHLVYRDAGHISTSTAEALVPRATELLTQTIDARSP